MRVEIKKLQMLVRLKMGLNQNHHLSVLQRKALAYGVTLGAF